MQSVKFRVRDWKTKEVVAYEFVWGNAWRYTLAKSNYKIPADGVYPGHGIREQYTGVHSTDGVEIYEGDVVERLYDGETMRGYVTMTDEGMWSASRECDCGVERFYFNRLVAPIIFKVIGDIHDPKYAELAK